MLSAFTAVCRLELRRALRRPRLVGLNIVIPLLLVAPIAFGGAPPAHAAAVYTVLFVLFGTFGAAIPALRDGEDGLMRRIRMSPLDARGVVIGKALTGACVDLLQLLPSLAIIVWAGNASGGLTTRLLVVLAASLLMANLIGLFVAALARSVGEGALFAAITALLLLHASSVFRTPAAGSLGARIETVAPYHALHELLLSAAAGTAAHADRLWIALLVTLLAATIGAGRLLRALASADGED